MNVFLTYCKKQLKKQRSFLLLILLLLLCILYLLWGPKIINYMRGPEDIYKIFFQESRGNHNFFSLSNLENRYAKLELHEIKAGFADIVKGRETIGIYYLYPINNEQYIILHADKSEIKNLENLYYNNIDKENLPLVITGGFQQLNEEVQKFAFTYLHEKNPSQFPDDESMEGVLLPFIFVSNHLSSSSIILIKATFYIFLFLIIASILLIILDFKYISIKFTLKSIYKLSKENQNNIDYEYKNSKKVYRFAFGEKLLFYHFAFQYTVVSYDDIVWMYEKKSKFALLNTYYLWMYFKDGTRKCVHLGNNKKLKIKIINRIYQENNKMLIGYQVQLYDKYKMSKEEFLKFLKVLKGIDVD